MSPPLADKCLRKSHRCHPPPSPRCRRNIRTSCRSPKWRDWRRRCFPTASPGPKLRIRLDLARRYFRGAAPGGTSASTRHSRSSFRRTLTVRRLRPSNRLCICTLRWRGHSCPSPRTRRRRNGLSRWPALHRTMPLKCFSV